MASKDLAVRSDVGCDRFFFSEAHLITTQELSLWTTGPSDRIGTSQNWQIDTLSPEYQPESHESIAICRFHSSQSYGTRVHAARARLVVAVASAARPSSTLLRVEKHRTYLSTCERRLGVGNSVVLTSRVEAELLRLWFDADEGVGRSQESSPCEITSGRSGGAGTTHTGTKLAMEAAVALKISLAPDSES
ncbi:hypothetical protein K438DRAFT_1751117 [Mycena galopus ATCC 62051]|nr:hypothetical protein K438DRAFT_1751117 [Mycena galopus ATCC 62051]